MSSYRYGTQVKSSQVNSTQLKSSQVKSTQLNSTQVKYCTLYGVFELSKDDGEAGTSGHTRDTDRFGHTDHTDVPHINHPDPPTHTHDRGQTTPEPTEPHGRLRRGRPPSEPAAPAVFEPVPFYTGGAVSTSLAVYTKVET